MTLSVVSKKSAMKASTNHIVNGDGVVVIDPGPDAVYQIDATGAPGQAVRFTGAIETDDVSYQALYLLAKAEYPTMFP